MKLSSVPSALIVVAALAAGVAYAESDKAAAPQTTSQADKAAAKPHSHVQEKTGIPQSPPAKKADKPDPAKDMTKHYHPRDNK